MYEGPPTTFEELLAPHPKEVRDVPLWLRSIIEEEFPELEERIYGGTKVANALYSVGAPDRVALGLQPGSGCMKLFLHDPEHLETNVFRLEGSGKHMRHMKLRTVADDQRDELVRLAAIPVSRRT